MPTAAKGTKSPEVQVGQFFSLTILFSWVMWLPGVLITYKLIHPNNALVGIANILKWVGGFGPSLVALCLIIRHDGKTGVKALLKRVVDLRLGWWYVPAFLLLPLVLVAAHLLNMALFDAPFPKTGLLAEPWWGYKSFTRSQFTKFASDRPS